MYDGRNGVLTLDSGRILVILLGACVALAAIGFEFAFGLTAARLALLFATVAALISIVNKKVRYNLNLVLQSYYALGLIFFVAACLSYLLIGGQEWAVISWLLMGLLGFFVLLGFAALDREESDSLFRLVVVFGLIFFAILIVYCVLLGVIFSPGYYFRVAGDEFASVGLNRVVNAMIFFGGAFFVTILDDRGSGNLRKAFALVGVCFLLYFSFAAGARQGILGFLLFVGFYFIARVVREGVTSDLARVFFRFGILLAFALPVGLFFSANVGVDGVDWFLERFLGTFESGGNSSDADRLGALQAALDYGFRNSGFGVGFGNFKNIYGIEPHNGYAGLFAEIGVYLFVFCIIGLGIFGFVYYFSIRDVKGLMPTFLMAYLPVHFLFVMNVKDLLREPFTWVILGMIGLASLRDGLRSD